MLGAFVNSVGLIRHIPRLFIRNFLLPRPFVYIFLHASARWTRLVCRKHVIYCNIMIFIWSWWELLTFLWLTMAYIKCKTNKRDTGGVNGLQRTGRDISGSVRSSERSSADRDISGSCVTIAVTCEWQVLCRWMQWSALCLSDSMYDCVCVVLDAGPTWQCVTVC